MVAERGKAEGVVVGVRRQESACKIWKQQMDYCCPHAREQGSGNWSCLPSRGGVAPPNNAIRAGARQVVLVRE